MTRTRNVLLACLCAFLFTSHRPLPGNGIRQFTPVKDFRWLKPYRILSECLSWDHYTKTRGKSFDSTGVSLTSGKYHPVNLFQAGILAYDLFRKTGEAVYRERCIAQYSYFSDTSRYTTRDDGSIGFPYDIVFRDLKPQWYSGLAQAEGIMYLIRYYVLTNDKRALPLIHAVRAFMLTPVDSGGTLNLLSPDECWIEEYVGSQKKKEVINGFATAIIGLNEYCTMFPDDKASRAILEKCIRTHKKWLYKYDTGSGILYDQGEKPVVNPWYSKFQVIQMKQFYEQFGDIFYHDIEMLWATYAYDKLITNVDGCLLTDTNFSIPASADAGGWMIPAKSLVRAQTSGDVKEVLLPDKMVGVGSNRLCDGNEASLFVVRNTDSLQEPPYVRIVYSHPFRATTVLVNSVQDPLEYSGFVFRTKRKSEGEWEELPVRAVTASGRKYFFQFDERPIAELQLIFSQMNRNASLGIMEIGLMVARNDELAPYSHFLSDEFRLSDSVSVFELNARDVDDFVVFRKTASTRAGLQNAKWDVYNGIREKRFAIETADAWCRFLVIFGNRSKHSGISGPVLQK